MLTRAAEAVWTPHPAHDPGRARALADALGAPPLIGQLLLNRGIADADAARRFLAPAWEHLHDPMALLGMAAAVARIRAALAAGERILVHGDYDVDGVTATFLLVATLRALGGTVEHRIPHRTRDGYGLTSAGVEFAARCGARLIVTVDCGITAGAAVEAARAAGIDVVVTDHHEPSAELPRAAAILNPHQPGCAYPCKALAGVGVAFKLAQALLEAGGRGEWAPRLLDVVALGTIADAVPLVGENRVLARLGLERMSADPRPGLRALIEICGLAGRAITAGHVAFQLAPRINAAGRMGSADQALELLFARDPGRTRALAESLDEDNQRRRELDVAAEIEAAQRVEHELGWPECWSIVLWSEHWHPGVLGIVASRMVERFQRPTVLIALQGDAGKGSGRSIPGLDLTRLLGECEDLLVTYGGHAYAAGLAVERGQLQALRERIEARVRATIDAGAFAPRATVDAEVGFAECSLALVDWLDRLPPHGFGNPEPVLVLRGATAEGVARVGDGRHLKFQVRTAEGAAGAIGFGLGEQADVLARAGACDLTFVPQRNVWNGETRLQFKVKGLRLP